MVKLTNKIRLLTYDLIILLALNIKNISIDCIGGNTRFKHNHEKLNNCEIIGHSFYYIQQFLLLIV